MVVCYYAHPNTACVCNINTFTIAVIYTSLGLVRFLFFMDTEAAFTCSHDHKLLFGFKHANAEESLTGYYCCDNYVSCMLYVGQQFFLTLLYVCSF